MHLETNCVAAAELLQLSCLCESVSPQSLNRDNEITKRCCLRYNAYDKYLWNITLLTRIAEKLIFVPCPFYKLCSPALNFVEMSWTFERTLGVDTAHISIHNYYS